MATETIRRSDYSEKIIPAGTGARVRVMFADGRTDLRADLLDEEVKKLLPFAHEVQARPDRRRASK